VDADRENGYYKIKYNKLEDYENGIPRLAAYLDSSESYCMYRRFGPTVTRRLLHLEIELDELEQRLHKLDQEDAAPGGKLYRLHSVEHKAHWDAAQVEILEQFDIKIRKYYDLLLKHFEIMALGQPTDHDHQSVCNWINDNKPLVDPEDKFIVHFDDLISAKKKIESSSQNNNSLEKMIGAYASSRTPSFISRRLQKLIKSKIGDRKTDNKKIIWESSETVATLSRVVMVFLAVSFLLIPVFLLFLVKMTRPAVTLTVLAFVLAFAVALAGITQAKAQEILIGTAAYGAFLVVFLGNVNSGSCCALGSGFQSALHGTLGP